MPKIIPDDLAMVITASIFSGPAYLSRYWCFVCGGGGGELAGAGLVLYLAYFISLVHYNFYHYYLPVLYFNLSHTPYTLKHERSVFYIQVWNLSFPCQFSLEIFKKLSFKKGCFVIITIFRLNERHEVNFPLKRTC